MSLPLLKLVYLEQLRGFVAVGRHQSMAQAADELCLTPSAISRQIKHLEERLGVPLVKRHRRGITLTPQGRQLFDVADTALLSIQKVIGELNAESREPVTISGTIGIASLWLLPVLGGIDQTLPGVEVRLMAVNRVLADLDRAGVDLALRYCSMEDAPTGAEHLFDEALVPVAHPGAGLAQRTLREVIQDSVLIEYEDLATPWLQWSTWLGVNGLGDVKPKAMLRFNHYDQVVQAAMAGQGIALGRSPLVASAIQKGLLERSADQPWIPPKRHAYWLVRANHVSAATQSVREWLKSQAQRTVDAWGTIADMRAAQVSVTKRSLER